MTKKLYCVATRSVMVALLGFAAFGAVPVAAEEDNSATVLAQAETAENQGTPATADPEAETDKIIVTARRREEEMLSVPIAITAFSGDDLDRLAIDTLEDLRFHAPSLQVQPTSEGDSVPGFTIRGQRQTQGITTADPSVAIYFADQVQARPHGTNGVLYDLESVQVLKGPQGTLFGRNTTGGAILFNPVKPVLEPGVFGEVTAEVGNYDRYGGTAIVNLGAEGGEFAARFAGKITRRDGYVESLFDDRKFDNDESQSWRVSLRWQPTATFETNVLYQHYIQNNSGNAWRLVGVNPASTLAILSTSGVPVVTQMQAQLDLLDASDFHTVATDLNQFDDVETYNLLNTTTLDVGGVTLKNIVGYRSVEHAAPADYDGTTVVFNEVLGFPAAVEVSPFQTVVKELDGWQFSEEFQILGTSLDDRLDWIIGAYYFFEENDDYQLSELIGRRENHGIGENQSTSIYAQGTYRLPWIQGLSATAGFRYTWDDRSLDNRNTIQGAFDPALVCRVTDDLGDPLDPCSFTTEFSDSAATWTFSLDYQVTEELMVYAAHRRGYRSGGLQLYAISTIQPDLTFDPETVDDYEVGFKSEWDLAGVLTRLNTAFYYQDYKNIQRNNSVFVPAVGLVTGVFNAAAATIKGVEIEGTIVPVEWFELSGFFGYVDANYDEFIDVSATPPVDISDNDFAWVPEITAGVTARIQLLNKDSFGEIWLQGRWYTQDEQQLNEVNVPADQFGVLPGYDLFDLQVSWSNVMGNPNFDARLTVQNLTDEGYYTSGVGLYDSLGFTPWLLGDPRTIVGSITYRFGGR